MTTIRQRATALLDVLRYTEDGDVTAESVSKARSYRASIASGIYPSDSLEWAWADPAQDPANPEPGELDRRKRERVEGRSQKTAFGAMYEWLKGTERLPMGTQVLSGSTGSGKNVAAVYAAVHCGGVFYFAPHIGDLDLGESPVLRELERVPFLVLDELGREPTIGSTPQRVVAMLTKRHDNRLTTLITTNLPADTADPDACFAGRYGRQLLDRVENSGGYNIAAGSSRRRRGIYPRLDVINRHCEIADLVSAVYSLTTAMPGDRGVGAIDKLAATYQVTDAQIEAALERRRRFLEIPTELAGGPIGRALRVAAGLEAPAPDRRVIESLEVNDGT